MTDSITTDVNATQDLIRILTAMPSDTTITTIAETPTGKLLEFEGIEGFLWTIYVRKK